MTEFTLLKDLMLIKQVHEKRVIFLNIGNFQSIALGFNQMTALGAMMY